MKKVNENLMKKQLARQPGSVNTENEKPVDQTESVSQLKSQVRALSQKVEEIQPVVQYLQDLQKYSADGLMLRNLKTSLEQHDDKLRRLERDNQQLRNNLLQVQNGAYNNPVAASYQVGRSENQFNVTLRDRDLRVESKFQDTENKLLDEQKRVQIQLESQIESLERKLHQQANLVLDFRAENKDEWTKLKAYLEDKIKGDLFVIPTFSRSSRRQESPLPLRERERYS